MRVVPKYMDIALLFRRYPINTSRSDNLIIGILSAFIFARVIFVGLFEVSFVATLLSKYGLSQGHDSLFLLFQKHLQTLMRISQFIPILKLEE